MNVSYGPYYKKYVKSLFFVCLFVVTASWGQQFQTVDDVDKYCSTLGFSSNEEAELAVDRILEPFGLVRNFVIQECPDINNAAAKVIEISKGYKERFILYDNEFFDNMNARANNDWAAMSILAHEIGHHLNGHSLNNEGSNHKWELEADLFSGSAMAKLGASLEEAQSAIASLKYDKATRTHPAKADRLDAIAEGWNRVNKGNRNNNNTKRTVVVENKTEDLLEVYDYDKERSDEYFVLGAEQYQADNYRGAADNFLTAFKYSNGTDYGLLYNTAAAYIGLRDYDNALKYYLFLFKKGIDQIQEDQRITTYKNIGLIYNMQGRSEEAIQFFDFALRSNPDEIELLLARANIFYELGDLDKFLDELKRIETLDPNNKKILYNLGVLYADKGSRKTAMGYYNRALRVDPDYADALLNKAALVLDEDTAIVEEMNSLGTSNADNDRYDELLEVRQKNLKAATVPLERIVSIGAAETQVLNSLYSIYNQLGDTANANRIKAMMD